MAVELGEQPHDVRLSRGDAEQARSAAADQDGNPGLDRSRSKPRTLEVVLAAGVGHAFASEEPADDDQSLLHAVDPQSGPLVPHPELAVIRRVPASPDAELDSAFRYAVERGGLAGKEQRMTVVVREDQGADADARGDRRGCGQRTNGRELVAKVIRHQEGVVSEVLGASREIGPGLPGRDSSGGHPESERMHRRTVADPRPWIGESHDRGRRGVP